VRTAPVDSKVVVDASAVLAWVFREAGHQIVSRALPVSVLPVPNAVEVLARAAERGYPGDLLDDVQAMGVWIEDVVVEDVSRAAELLTQSRRLRLGRGWGISLGDALCLSVAERLGLPILGGDQAWEKLSLKVRYRLFRR
jgi:PIN domain nuclease of toxin-antitoxin system